MQCKVDRVCTCTVDSYWSVSYTTNNNSSTSKRVQAPQTSKATETPYTIQYKKQKQIKQNTKNSNFGFLFFVFFVPPYKAPYTVLDFRVIFQNGPRGRPRSPRPDLISIFYIAYCRCFATDFLFITSPPDTERK